MRFFHGWLSGCGQRQRLMRDTYLRKKSSRMMSFVILAAIADGTDIGGGCWCKELALHLLVSPIFCLMILFLTLGIAGLNIRTIHTFAAGRVLPPVGRDASSFAPDRLHIHHHGRAETTYLANIFARCLIF